ncbi:MAG: tetratricopeptide repeat protein [Bacteroidia bacterium]|nr:tetratricopeptide repeat protein [Bacteroidia bacterium]
MNDQRVEQLKQLLEQDPQDAFCRYALGLELAGSTIHQEEALQVFMDLLKDQPDYLPVYYQLGQLYKNKGMTEDALEVVERGMEIALQQGNRHTFSELEFLKDELLDQ